MLFVADLQERWRRRAAAPGWNVAAQAEAEQWWYYHRYGGQFMCIPIGALGVCFSAAGIALLLS